MSRRFEPPQLSKMLRERAKKIDDLLKQYEDLRYGDELWRYGDELWRQNQTTIKWICKDCGAENPPPPKGEPPIQICNQCRGPVLPQKVRLGTPPRTAGKPPQITVVSSPRNIFFEEEEEAEEEETSEQQKPSEQEKQSENEPKTNEENDVIELAFNPMTQAAIMLGEITQKEAYQMELEKRYNILSDLGVDERRNCVALIPWLRELASELTYILETREIYSTEIKAVYPELLTNLEVAIGTCDQLSHLLGKQNGTLTRRQYDELMVKLLHYTRMAQQAALQLADYHEEFMGAEITPFEAEAVETKWVLEQEEKKGFKKEFAEEETEGEKSKEEE